MRDKKLLQQITVDDEQWRYTGIETKTSKVYISDKGRVASIFDFKTGKRVLLKGISLNINKYPSIRIRNGNYNGRIQSKVYLLHRLIAKAFIPNPENKACINHINAIKTDYRLCNLEWVTLVENVKKAWEMGLYSQKRTLIPQV